MTKKRTKHTAAFNAKVRFSLPSTNQDGSPIDLPGIMWKIPRKDSTAPDRVQEAHPTNFRGALADPGKPS